VTTPAISWIRRFIFAGFAKLVRTPHQTHAIPVGIASAFLNAAMTGALSYALRNANARVSHCGFGAMAIKSKRKTSKSSACRNFVGNAFSWTISKSISRARPVFPS
jgi:hypothetical protein